MSEPLPPEQQPQVPPEALAAAWAAQVAEVRLRIVDVVRAMWQALGSFRDEDADAFAEAITPQILAGQSQVQHLTESYLTQLVAQMLADIRHLGRAVQLGPLDYSNLRKATDPADVYRRPFVEVRTALSRGESLDDAIERGEERAAKLAQTDMQLAKTHTIRRTMSVAVEQTDAQLWLERTLRGDENCALCVVASTQRYRVTELQPIHPGCDCGVRPHRGPIPDQVIHEQRLEDLHDTLNRELGVSDRGGRAPDYRKIVTVQEHGEYGPVLTIARHDFTGPQDVPA